MRWMLITLTLLLAGAASIGTGLALIEDDGTTIERDGLFAVGTVVEVTGPSVRIEYRMGRELHTGVAYPDRGGPFSPGDVVSIRAQRDRPERVVIPGTEDATSPLRYVPWLLLGGALILAGLVWAVLGFVSRPVEGEDPRIRWISERHGA